MFRLCCGKRSAKVEDVIRPTRSSERSVSVTPPPPPPPTEKTSLLHRLFGRPMKVSNHQKKRQCVATSEDKATEPRKKAKKFWRRKNRVAPSPEEAENPKEEKQLEHKKEAAKPVSTKTCRQWRGFPNPAQICYLNSCLQSLLTLKDFVGAFRSQEQVWSSDPEATLIRAFMDIRGCHSSTDASHKIRLLKAFKEAVSAWDPEFQDDHQKDAHEFLTSVLYRMRCLGPQLQVIAASAGRTYSCPVEDHLVFRMQNIRTCKRCGAASITEEEYTNLSLDLVPRGGTVDEMLHNYLKETELDFNCECGATTSRQRWSFLNLPKVLVLHLKRFRFTPCFQLQKVHDPVELFGELVVSSNQGGGCFSLVSTISHISHAAGFGHYISDGVDVNVAWEDPTDRWFTYNDAQVTETTGRSVCDNRKNVSYILFYKRHD